MTQLSLILPELGKPDRTEDVKIDVALTTIQGWANGNIDSSNIKPGGILFESLGTKEASGQLVSGQLAPPTNVHTQIPGSEIKTPALVAGQVLVVWTTLVLASEGNEVIGKLTVNGVETGFQPVSNGVAYVGTVVYRVATTGVVSLAANAWATSSKGRAECSIFYEVRNT